MTGGTLDGWGLVVVAVRVVPAIVLALGVARVGLGRTAALAVALVVGLAIAAWGDASVTATASALARGGLGAQLALLGREAAVGLALGLTAAVPVVAAELVGDWLAAALGEPDGAGPWSLATGLIGALAFFALGGHRAIVLALAASYRALPAGADADAVLGVGATLIAIAVGLAVPLLGAVLVAVLAAAAVERAAVAATGVVPPGLALRIAGPVALAAMVYALAAGVGAHPRAADHAGRARGVTRLRRGRRTRRGGRRPRPARRRGPRRRWPGARPARDRRGAVPARRARRCAAGARRGRDRGG
jgi:flagellar biosynthesis protein FliR